MRALSPAEVLDSLHDRFRLLTGGARTAVRRQQTLRASVDWSHSLLTHAEAVLLRRLAVFSGGFDSPGGQSRCAAAATCSDSRSSTNWHCLSTSRLWRPKTPPNSTRYRLLETIRQYALEKLGESGEADAVRARASRLLHRSRSPTRPGGRADFGVESTQVEAELDNLRTAFAWSRDNGSIRALWKLASSLQPLWQARPPARGIVLVRRDPRTRHPRRATRCRPPSAPGRWPTTPS